MNTNIIINFEFNLHIILKLSLDKEFILQFYGSRQIEKNPKFQNYVIIQNLDQIQQHQIILSQQPKVPKFLHLRLYVNSQLGHENLGIFTDTLLAWGIISMQELFEHTNNNNNNNIFKWCTITLIDVMNNIQAHVKIKINSIYPFGEHFKFYNNSEIIQYTQHDVPEFDRLIESRLEETFRNLIKTGFKWQLTDYFSYVKTDIGQMPVSSFIDMTQHGHLATHIEIGQWFNHLIELTGHLFNFNNNNINYNFFNQLSIIIQTEWLSQTLAISIHSLIYLCDTTRLSISKPSVECDQWSRLLSFPRLHLSAFDCEDGMGMILELIHIFKTAEFSSNSVGFAMQQLLLKYVSFAALGTISTGTSLNNALNESQQQQQINYAGHALPILLDEQYVEHITQEKEYKNYNTIKYLPAIIIETTALIQNTWIKQSIFNNIWSNDDNYLNDCLIKENIPSFNLWNTVIKEPIIPKVIENQRLYGQINALITADYKSKYNHYKSKIYHWILKTPYSKKIGCDPYALFDYQLNHQYFHKALEIFDNELIKLANINQEMPCAHIPSISSMTIQPSKKLIYPDLINKIKINKILKFLYINYQFFQIYNKEIINGLNHYSKSKTIQNQYLIELWYLSIDLKIIVVLFYI